MTTRLYDRQKDTPLTATSVQEIYGSILAACEKYIALEMEPEMVQPFEIWIGQDRFAPFLTAAGSSMRMRQPLFMPETWGVDWQWSGIGVMQPLMAPQDNRIACAECGIQMTFVKVGMEECWVCPNGKNHAVPDPAPQAAASNGAAE